MWALKTWLWSPIISNKSSPGMTSDPVPPPYANAKDETSSDSDSTVVRLPAGVNPCNFVQVIRPKPIVGVWVLNPSKNVPKGTPNNLKLECTSSWAANSWILADVFVLPSHTRQGSHAGLPRLNSMADPQESEQTTIALDAIGWIKLRLHDASPQARNEDRLPIAVEAKSAHAMKLYLPKSFYGPLHLQAQTRVWYSSAVRAKLTPLSEVDGDHMAFLGDMDSAIWEGWQAWKGDSFSGDAGTSSIDVYFDDEDYIPLTDNNCVCM